MLATPGPLPTGPEWAYEVKLDGIRLIASLKEGRVRLASRNGKDLTGGFPELQDLAATLRDAGVDSVTLDGELIARSVVPPTLQAIAARIHRSSASPAVVAAHPVTYVVFDVTELNGRDLTRMPWWERSSLLDDLVATSPGWRRSEVFHDGDALWRATAEQGFEGVVAKRRHSTYQPGIRSGDWIKCVHRTTSDLVIIGWRPEAGSRSRVGSLIVAQIRDGELRFAGSAGSGMTRTLSDALLGVLPDIARTVPPIPVPSITPAPHWVEPALVVSIKHLGFTGDGNLRHPVIVALRPDMTAQDLLVTDGA